MSGRRWSLSAMPGVWWCVLHGDTPTRSEHLVVMPVSEHEELLKIAAAAVKLWDEAHETDNAIALGAAFVALRAALPRAPDAADDAADDA